MRNPIFKEGTKPGTHRIGEGKERKIRLRDIVSPQALVNEKKVRKLVRFTKNMPGTPTVSHLGHGKYVLKDGNHRVVAALQQGKRKVVAMVQRMSAMGRLIEFAGGDFHKRFAPDSILNTTKEGQEIRDAVNTRGPLVPVKDKTGAQKLRTYKHKVTGETLVTPQFSKERIKGGRRKAMEGAMLKTGLQSNLEMRQEAAEAHRKHLEKYKGDTKGANAQKSAVEARYLRAAKTDMLANLPGNIGQREPRADKKRPFLEGRVREYRDYAASELKESRAIIHGYAKANKLPIREAYRKMGDNAAIPKFRGKLNAGVEGAKKKSEGALSRYQGGVKNWLARGIQRQSELRGEALYPSVASEKAAKLLEPFKQGPAIKISKTERESIIPALQHGGGTATKTTKQRISVTNAVVDRIHRRMADLSNQVVSGAAGEREVKKKMIEAGDIFRTKATPRAAKEAPFKYTRLPKIGMALGGAALIGGGLYAKKRYDQTKEMSVRIKLIEFGKVRPSEKLHDLLLLRMPLARKMAVVDEALRSGQLAHKSELDFLKEQNAKLAAASTKHTEESAHEAMKAAHAPKRKQGLSYAKASEIRDAAHTRGLREGAAPYRSKLIAITDHSRAQGKLLKETEKESKRRMIGAVAGTAVAGTGGVLIGRASKREKETQFASRDERKLPASLTAGASAAATGSLLGAATFLKRGTTGRMAGRNAVIGGLGAAGLVGGGVLVGNRILGDPKKGEKIPITKRAAAGGAILGVAGGLGAGLIAHKTKWGKTRIATLAKDYKPAEWARKSGVAGAMGIGGVTGGVVGGYQSADEGQQVDTINSLRKIKRLSSALKVICFTSEEQDLKRRVAHVSVGPDKYKKKIIEDEHNRRDANYGRSALAGAGLGMLFKNRMKMPIGRAALVGAGGGMAAQAVIRNAGTRDVKDRFGEKTITAKRVEMAPWVAGGAVAAGVGARRLYKGSPTAQRIVHKYFSSGSPVIRFGSYDQQVEDEMAAYRMIYGRPRRTYSPINSQSQRYWRNLKRTGEAVGDLSSRASGKPNVDARGREKTPVWKKPWAIGLAGTAAVGGVLAARRGALGLLRKDNPGLKSLREAMEKGAAHKAARNYIPGYKATEKFMKGTYDEIAHMVDKPAGKLAKKLDKAADKPELIPVTPDQKKAAAESAAKAKKTKQDLEDIGSGKKKFSSRMKLIEFAYPVYGWDINHRSNKTATVYAPGAQMRERREKHLWERQGVQRGALLATTVGAAFGGRALYKKGQVIKKAAQAEAKAAALVKQNAERAGLTTETIKAENRNRKRGVSKIIAGNFRGPDDIVASSKLKPIYFDYPSRRDPEERLRDRLTIASKIASTTAGLGVLGLTGYAALKLRKHGPSLLKKAHSVAEGARAVADQSLAGTEATKRVADELAGSAQHIKRVADSVGGAVDEAKANAPRIVERMSKIPILGRLVRDKTPKKQGWMSRLFGRKPKETSLSSRGRVIRFEDRRRDYAGASAIGVGGIGALGASQYIGGRKMKQGEDVTGKRLVRRHRAFTLAHHEGIGIGPNEVAEVHNQGHPIAGKGRISSIAADKFGWGNQVYVIDEHADLNAAKKAKSKIGKPFNYNILTRNCQDFTDCVRGKGKRVLSKQWGRAATGLAVGAGVGYGAAKLVAKSHENRMSAKLQAIRFEKKDQKMTPGTKLAIAGGIGAAGLGASFMPGAKPMLKIAARKWLGAKGGLAQSEAAGGHFVADYMEGAHKGLRGGVHGSLVGRFLDAAEKKPKSLPARIISHKIFNPQKLPASFAAAHMAKFSRGGKEALGHWDWEQGLHAEEQVKQIAKRNPKLAARAGRKLKSDQERMHYAREKVHGAIDHLMKTAGLDEHAAIRQVATTGGAMVKTTAKDAAGKDIIKSEFVQNHPEARQYFNKLAGHKIGAAEGYAKKATIAPGLMVAGGATAGTAAIVGGSHDRGDRRLRQLAAKLDSLILT